jgi:hypothetical protein
MPFKNAAQRKACFARNDPKWDCHKWAHEGEKGKKKKNEEQEGEEVTDAPKPIPSFSDYVAERDAVDQPEPEQEEKKDKQD